MGDRTYSCSMGINPAENTGIFTLTSPGSTGSLKLLITPLNHDISSMDLPVASCTAVCHPAHGILTFHKESDVGFDLVHSESYEQPGSVDSLFYQVWQGHFDDAATQFIMLANNYTSSYDHGIW